MLWIYLETTMMPSQFHLRIGWHFLYLNFGPCVENAELSRTGALPPHELRSVVTLLRRIWKARESKGHTVKYACLFQRSTKVAEPNRL